ncbi:MAG: hypothetical protein K9G59_00690 [Caulobacter sp.]|nr:hypothetical protein [Caulobacter sp.]
MRLVPGSALLAAALLLAAGSASAGTYRCLGGARVLADGRCSDGSIAIYEATPMTPERPVRRPPAGPDRRIPAPPVALSSLYGAWSTSVPGAVWQTPSAIPGWATLHISRGALAGLLVIYPDGRYVWNAYGGKRGVWRRSGDPEYPILIEDRAERRTWKVGPNLRQPGRIYIVEGNGYFHYEGRRAR